jgi:peptidoglycan hydrolase CwlO-like protein
MNIVRQIAAMLTDDPNVFLELDASLGASSMGAANVGTANMGATDPSLQNNNIDKEAAKREKEQKDLEAKLLQQQKKILQPQVQTLKKTVDKTQTGVLQHQQTVDNMGKQTTGLDREMRNIQNLLNQLDKTI